jgi:hypothetical protein
MSTATAVLDLEKAGFTREQVEALARFHEAHQDLSGLVTKADLKAELAEVRREMADVKADLIKWMFGAAVGQVGLLFALLKLFPGGGP